MGITYLVVVHIHILPFIPLWVKLMYNQLWSIHIYFLVSYSQFNIYLFSSVKSGTHSFVKLLSHQLTHLLCCCFYFMGFIDYFWFVILHRNIQHTKLLGGMCDTVKIISPNHHLFSPHMFDFIVNNSSLYHLKPLVKFI